MRQRPPLPTRLLLLLAGLAAASLAGACDTERGSEAADSGAAEPGVAPAGTAGTGAGVAGAVADGDAEIDAATAAPATAESEIPPPRPTAITRDSSGVRVVESPAPLWSEAERWTLTPEPLVQVGSAEGDPAHLLTSVIAGALAPDGAFALLDPRSMEVGVYHADGSHRMTVGGIGGGPGEFARSGTMPLARPLAFGSADTLLTWDQMQGRLSWFDGGGRVARTVTLANTMPELFGNQRIRDSWSLLSDGSLLWLRDMNDQDRERIGQYAVALVAAGAEESVQVSEIPGRRRVVYQMSTTASGNAIMLNVSEDVFPMSPFAAVTGDPLRAYISDPERWEVRVHGEDGRLREIFRPAIARTTVSGDIVDIVRAQHEARGEAGRQAFHTMNLADSLPAIDGQSMFPDGAGHLWVRRYVTLEDPQREPSSQSYEVFRLDGQWLGTVAVPGGERVLAIGGDRVLTTYRDAQGVTYARVHGVVRPGTAGDG